MPQNEYIERFRKQYGERCVATGCTIIRQDRLTIIADSISLRGGGNASPEKATPLRRKRRIYEDFAQSYTNRSDIRRRSR